MAKDNESELRMRLVRKTDSACLVTNKVNVSDVPAGRRGTEFWLPRSLMGTMSQCLDEPNYPTIRFTLPDWKIEQDNLWDFVTS